jgi:hypothetical protein
VPWVVKSSPWSADSGAVPATIVIVPPFVAPVLAELLLLDDELELELELQAPSATTTAPVTASGMMYLFMGLLHRHQ